jgi:hypothetical protein
MPVSVEFRNGVGLSTFATETITFVPPRPPEAEAPAEAKKKKVGPGRISGRVVQNGIPQPGLTVDLAEILDPAPKTPKEPRHATTDGEGRYTFENVKPGDYTIRAVSRAATTRAQRELTVEGDKTQTVDLELTRTR